MLQVFQGDILKVEKIILRKIINILDELLDIQYGKIGTKKSYEFEKMCGISLLAKHFRMYILTTFLRIFF